MKVEFINIAEPDTVFFDMHCDCAPREGEKVYLSILENRKRVFTVVGVEHIISNPNNSPRDAEYPCRYQLSILLAEIDQ